MIVDGNKIAKSLLTDLAERVETMSQKPTLTVLACEPNFETRKYLDLKKSKAENLGINIKVHILENGSSTTAFLTAVKNAVGNSNGIIVQLPLPIHINTKEVLKSIPATHDVDAFSYGSEVSLVLPPVVGAINIIGLTHQLIWKDKKVVIFGSGRLVGLPAAIYAKSQGSKVTVISETSTEVHLETITADIIILGAGKANLLKSDMVKEGVVVFDAGASEDGGLLVGDASPEVSIKAAIFTPVPGGIGPVTIAVLFSNLLELAARQ
jgi:methylenetetrahydrofolate dehydrogenase (NADP+)/methenyltetrahydrofolate cyclohydrolase